MKKKLGEKKAGELNEGVFASRVASRLPEGCETRGKLFVCSRKAWSLVCTLLEYESLYCGWNTLAHVRLADEPLKSCSLSTLWIPPVTMPNVSQSLMRFLETTTMLWKCLQFLLDTHQCIWEPGTHHTASPDSVVVHISPAFFFHPDVV